MTLRKQGARIPHLWASLQLSVPDNRLPQLAAWLGSKSDTISNLAFKFQLRKGDWLTLSAALQLLTRLTCLQLTCDNGWECSPGIKAINFRGVALRALRR